MTLRAVAYARLSTDRQNESGIQDQLFACRRFAEARGWTITDEVAEEGISAASRHNRPKLLDLMARIDSWDVLLCWSSSRLARNQEDLGWISNRLRAHRRTGFEVNTGLELLNVGARVMGALHEEYLHQLREDTRRGLLGRAKANLSTGGTPFGYRTEAIGGEGQGARVVIHEDEAAVVCQLFQLYLCGCGLREIAHQLNAQGIPSPRARALRDRRPSWAPSAIREMLRNPVYIGRWTFNRTEWVKDHETGRRRRHARPPSEWVIQERPELAIIDADTFERVQTETRRRAGRFPRTSSGMLAGGRRGCAGPARYALSGALECASCGGSFHVQTGSTYGCSWHRGRGPSVCASTLRVPRAVLEKRVFSALRAQLTPETVLYAIESAFRLVAEALDSEPAPDPRLAELESQLEVLRELGRQGRAVGHLIAELEAERARIAVPARPAVNLDELRPLIEQRVRELHRAFEASPEDCRAALRGLLADGKLRVREDAERGFAVEGFLEVEVPGSRSLAEPGRSGGGI